MKVIWIASMPRSGSMWTYNVTRAVLEKAGCSVEPSHVPDTVAKKYELAKIALRDPNSNRLWVLKVHSLLSADFPNCRFITTHRDPRDALVSFMNFMRCDFDHALRAMVSSAATCDYYRAFPPEIVLHLDYPEIAGDPGSVIRKIALFLEKDLSAEEVDGIVSLFSKSQVAKRIANTEADIRRRTAEGLPVQQSEIRKIGPGNVRTFDRETGFQSGHVSDYQDGEWRKVLIEEQINRLQEQLGEWLIRNGYPVP
jgi:hypothetical protein